MARLRLGVLISGRGSNLQSIIDACAAPGFPAEVALVLSNVPGVFGLDRAAKAGIPCTVVNHKDYADRPSFEAVVDAVLCEAGVQLVCLAGFMRLLTEGFVSRWHDRLINIHPALLPAFPGLHTHERALAAGVRFAGCTVHFVRSGTDDGPIIVQAAVPVLDGDTPDALAARILEQEHRIYPHAIRLFAEGRIRVSDGRVHVAGARPCTGALVNPPL